MRKAAQNPAQLAQMQRAQEGVDEGLRAVVAAWPALAADVRRRIVELAGG